MEGPEPHCEGYGRRPAAEVRGGERHRVVPIGKVKPMGGEQVTELEIGEATG